MQKDSILEQLAPGALAAHNCSRDPRRLALALEVGPQRWLKRFLSPDHKQMQATLSHHDAKGVDSPAHTRKVGPKGGPECIRNLLGANLLRIRSYRFGPGIWLLSDSPARRGPPQARDRMGREQKSENRALAG
jgi:hypothetical protein